LYAGYGLLSGVFPERHHPPQRLPRMTSSGSLLTLGLLAAMATVIGACSVSGWGPLTIVESTGDDARAEGVLGIDAECVYLESGDGRSLLAWPADRTTWNALEASVSFAADAGTITLRDGDEVVLGGSSFEADRDGQIGWIIAPQPACEAIGNRWQVSGVSVENEAGP